MGSPPLYRAPPAPTRRPPMMPPDGHTNTSNNDSDDIYEHLPSAESDIGSEEALVRPSMIRQRQHQQHLTARKNNPDNYMLKDLEKFDNLWDGARRSHRDLGTGIPNAKSQQPYSAFATGRRHHSNKSLANNNGTSMPMRQGGTTFGTHQPGNPMPGRINMADYTAVTDALSKVRFPRTSPPYSNLGADDYVSDTGHRNRSSRQRRTAGKHFNYSAMI